jgi:hypothetical protein
MALQSAFSDLVKRFERLLYVVSELAVILDPNPTTEEPHLVHLLWDSTVQLEAWAEEAVAAAKIAAGAAGYPLDIDRLRQQMIALQRTYNDISKIYVTELLANSSLAELSHAGRRGDPLRRWSDVVTQSIVQCRQPMFEVAEALFLCWQEMVERIGMSSISVQTKAVGQEISVPTAELRKVVERVG